MKSSNVGILTFHTALNYGAVLQAYALQKACEKIGCNAEIIDYRAEFNEKRFQNKKIKDILNLREIYNIIFRNGFTFNHPEAFAHFFKDLMVLSKQSVYNQSELKNVADKYDTVICGSDQIWNLACTENDDSYFLPFELSGKKASYAASFGVKQVPECYRERYIQFLSDYDFISVRENDGIKIVKDFTSRDAQIVLDPSFLISADEWRTIEDDTLVPDKPYIFMYLMSEDKELVRFAKNLSKKTGCKIIYVNDRLFKMHSVKNISGVSPEQWIALLSHSSYVVTNSFHGTAFSINFDKPFFVKYIPNSISNSRLENIVDLMGLKERVVVSKEQDIKLSVDFKEIGVKKQSLIKESYEYLEKITRNYNA